jgi:hypothetical protein
MIETLKDLRFHAFPPLVFSFLSNFFRSSLALKLFLTLTRDDHLSKPRDEGNGTPPVHAIVNGTTFSFLPGRKEILGTCVPIACDPPKEIHVSSFYAT